MQINEIKTEMEKSKIYRIFEKYDTISEISKNIFLSKLDKSIMLVLQRLKEVGIQKPLKAFYESACIEGDFSGLRGLMIKRLEYFIELIDSYKAEKEVLKKLKLKYKLQQLGFIKEK